MSASQTYRACACLFARTSFEARCARRPNGHLIFSYGESHSPALNWRAVREDPMPTPRFLRRWLRLPGRAALILGLGAFSTAGAQADAPDHSSLGSFGDISIRSEGGKIYLSEGGQNTELQLGATSQRDNLLRLLEEHGPAGVKLDPDPRLIMSGGGGTGFSLWDIKKSLTSTPAPAPRDPPQLTAPPNPAAKGSAPRRQNPTTEKKG
jgi:hypothetical protein